MQMQIIPNFEQKMLVIDKSVVQPKISRYFFAKNTCVLSYTLLGKYLGLSSSMAQQALRSK